MGTRRPAMMPSSPHSFEGKGKGLPHILALTDDLFVQTYVSPLSR